VTQSATPSLLRPSSAMDLLDAGPLFPQNPSLSQQENRHPRIRSGLPWARQIYGRAIEEHDRTMFESVRIKKPYKQPQMPPLVDRPASANVTAMPILLERRQEASQLRHARTQSAFKRVTSSATPTRSPLVATMRLEVDDARSTRCGGGFGNRSFSGETSSKMEGCSGRQGLSPREDEQVARRRMGWVRQARLDRSLQCVEAAISIQSLFRGHLTRNYALWWKATIYIPVYTSCHSVSIESHLVYI